MLFRVAGPERKAGSRCAVCIRAWVMRAMTVAERGRMRVDRAGSRALDVLL